MKCHLYSFRSIALTAVLFFISIAVHSCRSVVLEDRSVCPSWILLKNSPSVSPEMWNYFKLSLWKDWEEDSEEIVRTLDLNAGYRIEWRKEHLFEVTGITGWDGIIEGDGRYLVPLGSECPEAMGGYTFQEIGGEEVYEIDFPVRSLYANVFIDIEGASSRYPFKAVIRGAVDGYTFPYLRLHGGPLECETRELSYEIRAARIPRQDEPAGAVTKAVYVAGLKVDFYFLEEGHAEWERFYTLPLGEIITMNGYDWSEPVLEDIHVKIRLADGGIALLVVEVADWRVVVLGEDSKYVV